MSLELEFYSDIHIGLKRAHNQDALFINTKYNLFSVADGLGGHLGGEVASSLALSLLTESITTSLNSSLRHRSKAIIKKAFKKANKDIYEQSQAHMELRGMGTTMVVAWLQNEKVYIGHVGDSRAYLYREGQLWQLTDDHILSMEASKRGFEYQQGALQQRDPLTNSVGFTNHVQVDILTRDIIKGDTYLLCSDGLHGMVSDQVILDVLKSEELKDVPKKCIIKALSAGGYDNVSVIVVKIVSC